MKEGKLTIELVPSTCWFSNVRDHVTKGQWEQIKSVVTSDARRTCAICGGRGDLWPVECHEVWKYDDRRRVQRLVGIVALCPDCHKVKHIGLAYERGEYNVAKAHLARVNGWTDGQAEDYIGKSFTKWQLRSLDDWTLDLSWLEKTYGIKVKSKRLKKRKSLK